MHDDSCFSIPNYSLGGDYLDTANYWRGPVWINTNWLLMQGLHGTVSPRRLNLSGTT
jgi:hypothetical protein